MISTPLSARILRPSSTSVPSSRTTSGTLKRHLLVGFEHRVGDRRAPHDAAEDVDQHGLHVLVGKQNAERFGHLLDLGAAADVEEVRRFAAVQLDEVHRAHRQAGAVHQAADVAFELHVAEPRLAGPHFGGIFFGDVAQLGELLVPEHRVVVEGDLRIEGHQLARAW